MFKGQSNTHYGFPEHDLCGRPAVRCLARAGALRPLGADFHVMFRERLGPPDPPPHTRTTQGDPGGREGEGAV